jgi:hypothetical protein
MFEWEISYSKNTTTGSRIGCEMYRGRIFADSEDDARKIFAEEEPDMDLDDIRMVPDGSGRLHS